jgi:hypothetical protein
LKARGANALRQVSDTKLTDGRDVASSQRLISGYKFLLGVLGYDTKAIRTLVRLRAQDANERQEAEAILELYMQAIGMS